MRDRRLLGIPLLVIVMAGWAAPLALGAEAPLAHDDGKRDDKRSTAGGGHAVRFERPAEAYTVTAVRIHGERYGGGYDPFYAIARVSLCDAKLAPLRQAFVPYTLWEPGKPDWAEVPLEPCRVPGQFFVIVEYFPTATKGIYQSIDRDGAGHSFAGLPGALHDPLEGGDWMIRVVGTKKETKVAHPDADRSATLARGAGESTGKRSTAGSGHAVLFQAPSKQRLLTGIEICGQRYGGRYDPKSTFVHVFVCDKKLKVLTRAAAPYALFPTDELAWVSVDLPPTDVPRDFAILVYFEPTSTKGVYLGIWEESRPASLSALPGAVHGKCKKGEGWMVRAGVAASAGRSPPPAPEDASAGMDAVRLAEVQEALDAAEVREDVTGANALIADVAKEAPEEAARLGRFHESAHFLLRESGMADQAVTALLAVMEAAHASVVKRFGFERVSAIEGKKVHLLVIIDPAADTALFTNPRSADFSQVVLRGPPSALAAPTRGGPHVVYGFCHELGHVLIGWEDARHKWAHYVGSLVTSDVHAALGDKGWFQPYDFHTLEGAPRYEKEIAGAQPGLTDDESVARLFHEIGQRLGTEVYGKAVRWIIANRKGKPFEAVRLYKLADLRAALLDLVDEQAASVVKELFGG